ncbi:amidohydrolase [SAR202 cluster bacterium AC-409-J13_OGT_754m]|nr:amidohydrolase [SAR202 cluster bacterium AC-409-J13_OGT_754m]
MYKGYKVLDADAHIAEPHDLWSEFMEEEYYSRRPLVAPRIEGQKGRGKGGSFLPCELFPDGTVKKSTVQGGGGQRKSTVEIDDFMPEKYGQAWDADFTPESRVADMNTHGWDKQVCIDNFPGPMRSFREGKDQGLIWACARAYNNWARSFCDTDPSKLKMVGVLPNQHDVKGLIIEARRAVEELGAVTLIMPSPAVGKKWHDIEYDGFWKLCEDLDVPVSFHGVSTGFPHTGSRYQPRHLVSGAEVALEHALGFPFENMISLGHVIYLGILEKFPKLRTSFLEGNAGWLPFWLGRLDDHAAQDARQAMWFDADALSLSPSEYFLRQGYVACDPDEFALKSVVDLLGEDNIVWNTDYPHPDGSDPDKAVPLFLEQPIPESAKKKILWDNAVNLYGKRILS